MAIDRSRRRRVEKIQVGFPEGEAETLNQLAHDYGSSQAGIVRACARFVYRNPDVLERFRGAMDDAFIDRMEG